MAGFSFAIQTSDLMSTQYSPPDPMIVLKTLLALVVCTFSWVCWRILRRVIANSTLNNIPGPPSKSFYKGVFNQVFGADGWDFHKEMAEIYGGVVKIKALFGENELYVFDPKALHQIITKDQHIFEPANIDASRLVFGHGLLGTLGDTHRKQRKMLNPVFSVAHMREMVPMFYRIVHQLCDTLEQKAKDGPIEIDLLHWITRTALELIGQTGLGYSFDKLEENGVPHPYSEAVKRIVPASFKLFFPRRYLLRTIVKIGTPRMRRVALNWFPWKALHDVRDLADFMHQTSVDIYETKKKALKEGDESVARQIGEGKDILSILMRANMDASSVDMLPEDELIGQISTLVFAATDTTSSALSRIFYLLTTNPDVQDKLRKEIMEAKEKYGGDLPHDELVSLPYLDAVCRETLRLYPPVGRIVRAPRQDVVLSLSNPIKGIDGKEIREVFVPKHTNVIVGIISSNRNSEIWGEDSYEWKPERWLKPLPEAVVNAHVPGVYSNLMTFIGGGRSCIGFKFSQLEMKVVLSLLLESFKFSASDKKIYWRMTGIAAPTINNVQNTAVQLPIIIDRVKR